MTGFGKIAGLGEFTDFGKVAGSESCQGGKVEIEESWLEAATIAGVHMAFTRGALSCSDLVRAYLDRIAALDHDGVLLGSIITVNPRVLDQAAELDRYFLSRGALIGPLHGIPIVVKDQIDTEGITTTYGSVAFAHHVPHRDATVVRRLRSAGALILGKTNLPDFAVAWFGRSSAGGATKNPYDLTRDPGGSSSGTAVAVAANLALVGIGTDTTGSISVPSAFNNVTGVRVTTGLISRSGIAPLFSAQDTPGPIARTVVDAATVLDTLVGHDPDDPFTTTALSAPPAGSYGRQADTDDDAQEAGIQRIGVLRAAFAESGDAEGQAVNEVVDAMLADLRATGMRIIDPIEVPCLDGFVEDTAFSSAQSEHDLDKFLAQRPGQRTVAGIVADGLYDQRLEVLESIARARETEKHEHCYGMARRVEFARAILHVMACAGVDALLYPDTRILPPLAAETAKGRWTRATFPTNAGIPAQSDLPNVCVPAGFTRSGLPVGVELLGQPFNETKLLRLARYCERKLARRRSPRLEAVGEAERTAADG